MQELLERYSKYCPKCKTYQNSLYEECFECKTVLIDGRKVYARQKTRRIERNVLIVLLLIFFTYGIQSGERKHYNKGAYFLVTGKLKDSKAQFHKAFSGHPVFKFVNSAVEKIKYKITHRTIVHEIRYSPQHTRERR